MSSTVATTRESHDLSPEPGLIAASANLLAELSDAEFEAALGRVNLVIKRQKQIMENVLQEDVHFGNPKGANGKVAFKKDILFQQGADHLCETFRLSWSLGDQPDREEVDKAFVRVTVFRKLIDLRGRVIAVAEGTCTSHEKRFVASYGGGFTWGTDARGALHDIRMMALKRCRVSAVAEGLGLRAYIGTDTEPSEQGDDDSNEKPIVPWSIEEQDKARAAASKKGMVRSDMVALKVKVLGSDRAIGSGRDFELLMEGIANWTPEDRAKQRETGEGD